MFESEAIEFPFVDSMPKREKSRMQRVWDHFQEVKSIVAEKGMVVPQHLVAELLGVSRQRVGELTDRGRFEVVVIGGVRYLTERSVIAFAKEERKNGRPPKLPETNREMWDAAMRAAKASREK